MSNSQSSQKSQKAIFRILVATDNHIGFKEDHHIRGEDSFDAFEEILQIAKRNKVDFLLLGGDLFHELAPSQSCLYRSIRLLQKYVFGGGDVTYGTKTLTGPFQANYLNENLNIDLPIFVIHGNHDYPVSTGENISSLDLLHASRLINYFGKCKNLDELTIEPILFEKDTLRIALYGIGHIKDTRLHYLFEKKKVNFVPPPDDQYMNILILHQNRFKGIRPGVPYKNCIHPSQLPGFIDLIIWGNEHESTEELVEDPVQNFYVYQPGSSIATSLNQSEALPKHVGFFEITEKKNFKFVPILLRDQRRLYVKNLELEQLVDSKKEIKGGEVDRENNQSLEKEIEEKIEEEFNKILREHEENLTNQKKLKNPPLIRLKIEYSGFDIIRVKQVELKFMGKVANEGEVLKFWRKTVPKEVTDVKQNKKLGADFEDTLKQKISFETLASESNEVIRDIFEDVLQNSVQKPKMLLNFSQLVDQKFTFQGVSNQISQSISQAKKHVVTDNIREMQALSKRILQRQTDFIKDQYEGSESFMEEISVQIRDYEQYIQGIPKLLEEKLKDYNIKRIQQDMGEEEKDKKEDKKNGNQRKDELEIEEEKVCVKDKEKENGLKEMGTWGIQNNNDSEDEDKDWFNEDFGKKDKEDDKKVKKNILKQSGKTKSDEKGRISRIVESSIGTDFIQRLVATSDSKKKKRGFFSNMENEPNSPDLKRTKKAAFQLTQQKRDGTNMKPIFIGNCPLCHHKPGIPTAITQQVIKEKLTSVLIG